MSLFWAGDTQLEVGTALARADLNDRQSFGEAVDIVKRYCLAKMKKSKTQAVALPGGKLEALEKKYAHLGYQDVFYLCRLDLQLPPSTVALPRPTSPVRRRLVKAEFPLPASYQNSSRETSPAGAGDERPSTDLAPVASAASAAPRNDADASMFPDHVLEKELLRRAGSRASSANAYPQSVITTRSKRTTGTDASSDLLPDDEETPELHYDNTSFLPSPAMSAVTPRTLPIPAAPGGKQLHDRDFFDLDAASGMGSPQWAKARSSPRVNASSSGGYPPVPPPPGRPPSIPRSPYVSASSTAPVSLSPLVRPRDSPMLQTTALSGPSSPDMATKRTDMDIRALFDALPAEAQALAVKRLAEQQLEAQRRAEEALAAKRAAEAEALRLQRQQEAESRRAASRLLAAQTLGASPPTTEVPSVLDAMPGPPTRQPAAHGKDEDVRRMIEARIAALQTALAGIGPNGDLPASPTMSAASSPIMAQRSPPVLPTLAPMPRLDDATSPTLGTTPLPTLRERESAHERPAPSPPSSYHTTSPHSSSYTSTYTRPAAQRVSAIASVRPRIPPTVRAQPALFMDLDHSDHEVSPPSTSPLTPSLSASESLARHGSSVRRLRRTPPPQYTDVPSPSTANNPRLAIYGNRI